MTRIQRLLIVTGKNCCCLLLPVDRNFYITTNTQLLLVYAVFSHSDITSLNCLLKLLIFDPFLVSDFYQQSGQCMLTYRASQACKSQMQLSLIDLLHCILEVYQDTRQCVVRLKKLGRAQTEVSILTGTTKLRFSHIHRSMTFYLKITKFAVELPAYKGRLDSKI